MFVVWVAAGLSSVLALTMCITLCVTGRVSRVRESVCRAFADILALTGRKSPAKASGCLDLGARVVQGSGHTPDQPHTHLTTDSTPDQPTTDAHAVHYD